MRLNVFCALVVGLVTICLSQSGCQAPNSYPSLPPFKNTTHSNQKNTSIVLMRFHGELNGKPIQESDLSYLLLGRMKNAYAMKLKDPEHPKEGFSLQVANMEELSDFKTIYSKSLSKNMARDNWIYLELPEGLYCFRFNTPGGTNLRLPDFYCRIKSDEEVLHVGTFEFHGESMETNSYSLRDDYSSDPSIKEELSKLGFSNIKTRLLSPLDEHLSKLDTPTLEPIGLVTSPYTDILDKKDIPTSALAKGLYLSPLEMASYGAEGMALGIYLAVPLMVAGYVVDTMDRSDFAPCLDAINTRLHDMHPDRIFQEELLEKLKLNHSIISLEYDSKQIDSSSAIFEDCGSILVANISRIGLALCISTGEIHYFVTVDYLVSFWDTNKKQWIYIRPYHTGKSDDKLPYSKFIGPDPKCISKKDLWGPDGADLFFKEIENSISFVTNAIMSEMSDKTGNQFTQ